MSSEMSLGHDMATPPKMAAQIGNSPGVGDPFFTRIKTHIPNLSEAALPASGSSGVTKELQAAFEEASVRGLAPIDRATNINILRSSHGSKRKRVSSLHFPRMPSQESQDKASSLDYQREFCMEEMPLDLSQTKSQPNFQANDTFNSTIPDSFAELVNQACLRRPVSPIADLPSTSAPPPPVKVAKVEEPTTSPLDFDATSSPISQLYIIAKVALALEENKEPSFEKEGGLDESSQSTIIDAQSNNNESTTSTQSKRAAITASQSKKGRSKKKPVKVEPKKVEPKKKGPKKKKEPKKGKSKKDETKENEPKVDEPKTDEPKVDEAKKEEPKEVLVQIRKYTRIAKPKNDQSKKQLTEEEEKKLAAKRERNRLAAAKLRRKRKAEKVALYKETANLEIVAKQKEAELKRWTEELERLKVLEASQSQSQQSSSSSVSVCDLF